MKRFNEIIFTALIIIFILTSRSNADEGWWTYLRTAGGSLYSQEEHPDIVLEKEALIYKGNGECEAHFLFKNIFKKDISVNVGFPVKITIPLKEFSNLDPSKDILERVYGEDLKGLSWPPGQVSVDSEKLKKDIRKIISWKAFEQLNNFWGREGWVKIGIAQDGKDVAIDSVLVEGQLINGETTVIKFHFLHRLSFPSQGASNVIVHYSSNSVVMKSGELFFTDYIIWCYILGTGRTWSGPIKAIYIIVPDHLKPEMPNSLTYIGNFKKNTVFLAKNYDPLIEDEIIIRYLKIGQFADFPHIPLRGLAEFLKIADPEMHIIKTITKPEIPSQKFCVLKRASSYLPQRTWVNSFLISQISQNDPMWKIIFSPNYYKPFYYPVDSYKLPFTVEGVPTTCKNISFDPLSLFDGIPESAWCEGVKGYGIGEWVEFELKEDILGLAIYNGFRKGRWHLFEYVNENESKLKTKYIDNSRVKLLEFISNDGKIIHEIELKDTPEKQIFEDIYLPKGIYKLYIRDIYKGLKWDDTCLGEIEFFSASAKEFFEEDEFLKNVLSYHDLQN